MSNRMRKIREGINFNTCPVQEIQPLSNYIAIQERSL